jgi:hypothetical protein
LIIFKLDFAKAYDKVAWEFSFLTMRKIGVIEELVEMVFFFKRCRIFASSLMVELFLHFQSKEV